MDSARTLLTDDATLRRDIGAKADLHDRLMAIGCLRNAVALTADAVDRVATRDRDLAEALRDAAALLAQARTIPLEQLRTGITDVLRRIHPKITDIQTEDAAARAPRRS